MTTDFDALVQALLLQGVVLEGDVGAPILLSPYGAPGSLTVKG